MNSLDRNEDAEYLALLEQIQELVVPTAIGFRVHMKRALRAYLAALGRPAPAASASPPGKEQPI